MTTTAARFRLPTRPTTPPCSSTTPRGGPRPTAQRPSHNAHNDIVALNDHTSTSTTSIRWQTTLDPFGVVTSTSGTTAVPLGYQGMYTDQTTGLVDMGARFYEPATGRFTTPDTIIGDPGLPISFNRYLYGHSDPISHFDPDGHWPDWLDNALNAVSDYLDSWSNEFTNGLSSPGDATTSDDPTARFLGGAIQAAGELVTGATQLASTTTRCAKDQQTSCDALGQIFTEEGIKTAWHATADPTTNCVTTNDAATCGRATVSIAEIILGTKGAAKTASALAHAIPSLKTAIHPLGLLPETRMHSIGAGPSRTVRMGQDRIPVLPTTGPSVPFNGRVLLMGEGNFSFTEANIALGRAVPAKLTATAYTPDGWFAPDILARADRLRQMGAGVHLQVDARALPAELADGAQFDTVIFQLPHPGGTRAEVAAEGTNLLQGFFASASQRLAPGGQIALTLRNQHYVDQWHLNDAATAAGLRLATVTEFHPSHYPGYDFVTTMTGVKRPDVSSGLTFLYTSG